jgi:hypothetical protein
MKGDRYKNDTTLSLEEILKVLLANAYYIINNITNPEKNEKYGNSFKGHEASLKLDYVVRGKHNADDTKSLDQFEYVIDSNWSDQLKGKFNKRWMKSLGKFNDQTTNYLDSLYSDENVEKLITEFSTGPRTGPIPTKINFIDGFIMEGKSKLLSDKNMPDSELSVCWRTPLRDGSMLEHEYYVIFILCGLYKALLSGDNVLIDRCWGSMSVFDDIENLSKPHSDKKHRGLSQKFYLHLLNSFNIHCFYVCVMTHYSSTRPVMNIPEIDVARRELESKLYTSHEDLVSRASWFYYNLFFYYFSIDNFENKKRKM